jgi:hypothetical protein
LKTPTVESTCPPGGDVNRKLADAFPVMVNDEKSGRKVPQENWLSSFGAATRSQSGPTSACFRTARFASERSAGRSRTFSARGSVAADAAAATTMAAKTAMMTPTLRTLLESARAACNLTGLGADGGHSARKRQVPGDPKISEDLTMKNLSHPVPGCQAGAVAGSRTGSSALQGKSIQRSVLLQT